LKEISLAIYGGFSTAHQVQDHVARISLYPASFRLLRAEALAESALRASSFKSQSYGTFELSNMEYDFASYLSKFDPSERYSIERLTGGLVNITVRATKEDVNPEALHRERFTGRKSVILKYAPPYVAAVGESAPFSQQRQVSSLPICSSSD
jgi:hypothetical protein